MHDKQQLKEWTATRPHRTIVLRVLSQRLWRQWGSVERRKNRVVGTLGTVVQAAERETSEKKLTTNTAVANFIQIVTPVPKVVVSDSLDRDHYSNHKLFADTQLAAHPLLSIILLL